MSVLIESGHINEYPYNHARILYGNVVTAVTATGELNNFQANLALTDQTYERWSPAVSGDSITATFPAQNVNAIALAAHSNLNPTVEIRTSGGVFETVTAYPFEGPSLSSDFSLSDYGIIEYSPDNEAILFLIKPRYADAVRITLTYSGTSPTLGVLRVGNVLEMQRPFYQGHTPAILAADTTLRPNVSESGEWLGASLIRQGRSLGFSWKNLKADWVRKNWVPLAQSLKTKPFIIAWNPKRFSADCFYASTSTVPKPNNSGPLNYQSIDLNARAYSDGTDPEVENLAMATFDELFTFTRASTGTYYDIGGVLQTAAVDEPRFTYDPETGEALGLLIEEARTNLLLWSEAFDNAVWTKEGASIVNDSAGQKLVEDSANTPHRIFQVSGEQSGNDLAVSFVCKAAERNFVLIQETMGGTALFDLTAGTVLSVSGVGASAVIEPAENGYFRCSFFFSEADDVTVPQLYISDAAGNTSYQGDGTSGIYIWGAQLEAGSFPTSYIKTEGAQVTRAADNCSRTLGAEFNAVEGTVYVEVDDPIATDRSSYFTTGSTTAGQVFGVGRLGSIIRASVNDLAGVGNDVSTNGTPGKMKIAFSWNSQLLAISINGQPAATAGPPTTIFSPASLGAFPFWGGVAGGKFNSEKTEVYPRALSAAELQALTAP